MWFPSRFSDWWLSLLFRKCPNIRIRFGLQIVLVCLYSTPSHYHHCANLSGGIWIYKMPVRYILSSVCVRLNIFSPLSIIQYVGLYVFSLPISLVMIERIYILCLIIIIKSEVWTITHCLGLGHETMVSAVCLSILLWMSPDFTDEQSTLVQVMTWCRQAASHYPSQCWPKSMSPYGVTRPQWLKLSIAKSSDVHLEAISQGIPKISNTQIRVLIFTHIFQCPVTNWLNQ